MTAATDALARARTELSAAEAMGSPEVDVATAAVEQAEQAVEDEGSGIRWMSADDAGALYNADPDCKHIHASGRGPLPSGIRCANCSGWFCY